MHQTPARAAPTPFAPTSRFVDNIPNQITHRERLQNPMIFQYTYEKILRGEKTQTRRRIREGDEAIRDDFDHITGVAHNGRAKWVVGKAYAVQPGRNLAAVGRIQITAIDIEHILDATDGDAVAEGYSNRDEFLAAWETIHGPNAFDEYIWVVTFHLMAPEE